MSGDVSRDPRKTPIQCAYTAGDAERHRLLLERSDAHRLDLDAILGNVGGIVEALSDHFEVDAASGGWLEKIPEPDQQEVQTDPYIYPGLFPDIKAKAEPEDLKDELEDLKD